MRPLVHILDLVSKPTGPASPCLKVGIRGWWSRVAVSVAVEASSTHLGQLAAQDITDLNSQLPRSACSLQQWLMPTWLASFLCTGLLLLPQVLQVIWVLHERLLECVSRPPLGIYAANNNGAPQSDEGLAGLQNYGTNWVIDRSDVASLGLIFLMV